MLLSPDTQLVNLKSCKKCGRLLCFEQQVGEIIQRACLPVHRADAILGVLRQHHAAINYRRQQACVHSLV